MPRRRPSAVRAEPPCRSRRRERQVPGASPRLLRALARLEREREWLRPGRTAHLLAAWASFARLRHTEVYVGCGISPCCLDPADRPDLERVIRALPRAAGAELRRRVAPLDAAYFARCLTDPGRPGDADWWRRVLDPDRGGGLDAR
ncbi:hypothetical protein [Allonocardiopsis opalescens]|uniref:Uncharacterized protein n=1 Tax=Allonocardiopsis opalescens TaxID=1144618 RepID=A0A2T0Q2W1_9ACTN|nr:hypothetical protein [Allonocardiopsis opalescens]PRX98126.1 hypothetical protein CLV72_105479 [Allonocardiopsis opalescens]